MGAAANTQGYKGVALIAGVQYPLSNISLSAPENFAVEPVIGNYWAFNYGQGLIQPVVECTFVVRDEASGVLGLTFLDDFFTRSNDAAHDTTVLSGGLTIWDGRSGFVLDGAKAESFSISCAKGQSLNFTARFLGAHLTAINAASPPTMTAWSNASLVRFKNVTFASPLDSAVWDFGLSFSNNSTPDLSLDGTQYPTAINAGMQSAGLNITTQAATLVVPDNGTFPAPATPATIPITITGQNVTRVFTLNNPLDNTSQNRGFGAQGRVMRQHSYVCLGADGSTTPPLSVA